MVGRLCLGVRYELLDRGSVRGGLLCESGVHLSMEVESGLFPFSYAERNPFIDILGVGY